MGAVWCIGGGLTDLTLDPDSATSLLCDLE